jgi:hypothetical protein
LIQKFIYFLSLILRMKKKSPENIEERKNCSLGYFSVMKLIVFGVNVFHMIMKI